MAYEWCREEIRIFLKTISVALIKFDARRDEISNQQAAIEKEVHSNSTLDNRKSELISHLDQLSHFKFKSLAAQREQIETIQAQLNKHLLHMGDASKKRETLQMKSNTIQQVWKLIESNTLEPAAKADLMFLLLPAGWQIRDGSYPDPTKCFPSFYSTKAILRERSFLFLEARNYNGEYCELPLDSIQCELISDSTYSKTTGTVRDKGNFKYEISYRPTSRGMHHLHIKVEGQHIWGSPFPVKVESPEKRSKPILTLSRMIGPKGVAVNERGEVVVTEWNGHCVTVFSPNGEKLRSFGSQGSGLGQFQHPYGVAIDSEGNIFVTDMYNHRIQKFTPEGKFVASVGTKGNGILQFELPCGIAFNASNSKVYVVDESGRIQVLNFDLTYFSEFETSSSDNNSSKLRHIACDSTGNVYATDWYNHYIQVFSAEGKFLKVFGKCDEGNGRLTLPYGIAIDCEDRVYVSDWESNKVLVYNSKCQYVASFGGKGSGEGQFFFPAGLAVDKELVLFVCDHYNDRVQVF